MSEIEFETPIENSEVVFSALELEKLEVLVEKRHLYEKACADVGNLTIRLELLKKQSEQLLIECERYDEELSNQLRKKYGELEYREGKFYKKIDDVTGENTSVV